MKNTVWKEIKSNGIYIHIHNRAIVQSGKLLWKKREKSCYPHAHIQFIPISTHIKLYCQFKLVPKNKAPPYIFRSSLRVLRSKDKQSWSCNIARSVWNLFTYTFFMFQNLPHKTLSLVIQLFPSFQRLSLSIASA